LLLELVSALLILFAQTYPPDAWNGHYHWGTPDVELAYAQAAMADAAVIARERCGQPYFGTIC
jgi:hypothetical protein